MNDGRRLGIDQAERRDGGIRRRSDDEDIRGRADAVDAKSAHQDI